MLSAFCLCSLDETEFQDVIELAQVADRKKKHFGIEALLWRLPSFY
jgi:hypothetical protein